MPGTTLGNAYVQIIPSAQGISGAITDVLKGEGETAGKKTGGLFASGFGGKLKTGLKIAGAAVAGFSTVSAAAMTKAIKSTANYGDNIDKMSQKLGLSTDAYQKWDYVLNLSGTSIENVSIGIKTLTNKLDDAKNGSKTAIASFERLGLSTDELSNMSREDLFGAAIKSLQSMEDSAERAALANDIFGRSGQELTPLFNTSAEATQKLMEQAEKYGMVMSVDAVKASAAFNDSLTTMQNTITGLKNRMIADFLPAATKVTDGLAKMFTGDMSGLDDVVEGVKEMASKIVKLGPQLLSAGGKLIGELINGILEKSGELGDKAGELIGPLTEKIINKAPDFIKAAIALMQGLIKGLINALPNIASTLSNMISSMIKWFLGGGWKTVGSQMINLLTDGFKAATNALKTIVASIGKAIIESLGLDKLLDKVKNTIDRIKNFFKVKISFPHIPLPHFSISPSGWKVGDLLKGTLPSLDIQWYNKAVESPRMFSGATLFGAGETSDEILYGKKNLMRDIREATSSRPVSFTNYFTINNADDPEAVADAITRRLKLQMRSA